MACLSSREGELRRATWRMSQTHGHRSKSESLLATLPFPHPSSLVPRLHPFTRLTILLCYTSDARQPICLVMFSALAHGTLYGSLPGAFTRACGTCHFRQPTITLCVYVCVCAAPHTTTTTTPQPHPQPHCSVCSRTWQVGPNHRACFTLSFVAFTVWLCDTLMFTVCCGQSTKHNLHSLLALPSARSMPMFVGVRARHACVRDHVRSVCHAVCVCE